MQSMFGASERLLYLLEIVVSPMDLSITVRHVATFITDLCVVYRCFILETQVLARNLLQMCLCDLRLRRSHLIITVLF